MNAQTALLPPELWIKVLMNVVPRPNGAEEEFEKRPHRDPERRAPLNLATVCRSWRELIHTCPDLWTSLSYIISEHSVTNGGLIGVQAWLARSGNHALNLSIACNTIYPPVVNAFLEALYPHFSRLAMLRIDMDGDNLLPIPRVDMPWCWFVQGFFSYYESVEWFAPFFRNRLPALRALRLSNYPRVGVSFLPIEHHMSNLTHIHASANNFTMRPVDILRGCPYLVSCRLNVLRSRDGTNGTYDDTFSEPFTLARLRTLSIEVKESEYWRDVFPHATFPVLEELTLMGRMWPVRSFMPFLERSRCPLRRLSLPQSNISTTELLTIFGAVKQTLETFYLSGGNSNGVLTEFNDALLDSLHPTEGRDVLVPRLYSLEIITYTALQTTDGKLLDMVRARMTSTRTVPLQNIRLSCGWQKPEDPNFNKLDFEGVTELGQQFPGLKVKVDSDMKE